VRAHGAAAAAATAGPALSGARSRRLAHRLQTCRRGWLGARQPLPTPTPSPHAAPPGAPTLPAEYAGTLHQVLSGVQSGALGLQQLAIGLCGYLCILALSVLMSLTELRLPMVTYSKAPAELGSMGQSEEEEIFLQVRGCSCAYACMWWAAGACGSRPVQAGAGIAVQQSGRRAVQVAASRCDGGAHRLTRLRQVVARRVGASWAVCAWAC
jgi:hypothetical protein